MFGPNLSQAKSGVFISRDEGGGGSVEWSQVAKQQTTNYTNAQTRRRD